MGRAADFFHVFEHLPRILAKAQKLKRQAGENNFRKGATDEWRSVLSPRQRAFVTDLLPRRWKDEFGWPH